MKILKGKSPNLEFRLISNTFHFLSLYFVCSSTSYYTLKVVVCLSFSIFQTCYVFTVALIYRSYYIHGPFLFKKRCCEQWHAFQLLIMNIGWTTINIKGLFVATLSHYICCHQSGFKFNYP